MSTTIKPTVGRVVLIFFAAGTNLVGYALPADPSTPVPGLVTCVHSEACINVAAFDADGCILPITSVHLLQDGDERPTSGIWAEWMPYQVEQAKKAEAKLEAMSGGSCSTGSLLGAASFSPQHTRFDALSMALRTPGLSGHRDVLAAAKAYQAHIEGEATAPAKKLVTGGAGVARQADTTDAAIEQEIQAKGKTAPRITPDSIKAVIRNEVYFTARDGVIGDAFDAGLIDEPNGANADPALGLLTFCVLILRNGFTVTGESACASPENFDAEIGRKIARENAINKVWMLEGYLLKDQLHRAASV